jgi:D-glycero-D-manno-heptose 1,7-bisphosphate phosphatase
VELGYLSIKSGKFFEILRELNDLPLALERFSHNYESGSVELTNPYWSVSGIEQFLKLQSHRSIVLLDRDGVINKKMPKREYVAKWNDYSPILENWDGLRMLSSLAIDFIVVTNQPGIATGDVDDKFLMELHQRMVLDLMNFGINILAVYVCLHHWDENCECRKPKPGMLLTVMEDFHLQKEKTLYIGDDDRDLEAAQLADILGILIGNEHSGELLYSNVLDALPVIKQMIRPVE